MDGFALRGEETFGAEAYTPALFRIIGRSRPGRRFGGIVGPGEAVEIATGAPLPAVRPIRLFRSRSAGSMAIVVRVVEATPPGRHVSRRGEDIAAGTLVLEAERRILRPQDLGVLGRPWYCRLSPSSASPQVAVLVTGDELLPAGTPARGDQIADMNSVMVQALVARDGGLPCVLGPMADDRDRLEQALANAAGNADAVLISGGSSTGPEDHAPGVVARLGTLDFHGVACGPRAPRGWASWARFPLCSCPGTPSVACAPTIFLPVESSAGWADVPSSGPIAPSFCRLPGNWRRRSVVWTTFGCESWASRSSRWRSAALDPLQHHQSRWVRGGTGRSRRLSRWCDREGLALRSLSKPSSWVRTHGFYRVLADLR